jgi:hypothetical protein
MANRYRGEASLETPDGALALRLSLDALARLETAFGIETLGVLTETLVGGELTARQLQVVLLEALVAGSDVERPKAEALLRQMGTPLTLRRAYVDLMRATFVR